MTFRRCFVMSIWETIKTGLCWLIFWNVWWFWSRTMSSWCFLLFFFIKIIEELDFQYNTFWFNYICLLEDDFKIVTIKQIILNSQFRFTYEVAPVFTLMEREIFNKMLGYIGFDGGEAIFVPGLSLDNLYINYNKCEH